MKIRTITKEDLNVLCFNDKVTKKILEKSDSSSWLKDSLSEKVKLLVNSYNIKKFLISHFPDNNKLDIDDKINTSYFIDSNLYQAGILHEYIKGIDSSISTMRSLNGSNYFENINKILNQTDRKELLEKPFVVIRTDNQNYEDEYNFTSYEEFFSIGLKKNMELVNTVNSILSSIYKDSPLDKLHEKLIRTDEEEKTYKKLEKEHLLLLIERSQYLHNSLTSIEGLLSEDNKSKVLALKLILIEKDNKGFPISSPDLVSKMIDELNTEKYSQIDFNKISKYLGEHFPNKNLGLNMLTNYKIEKAMNEQISHIDLNTNKSENSFRNFKL